MTAEELAPYIGRSVELQLKSGATFAGELVPGESAADTGATYAIKSVHESATLERAEPTYVAIADAGVVAWVRDLEAPLDEDRLSD